MWRALMVCTLSACASSTPRVSSRPSATCSDPAAVAWLRGRWCGPHRDGVFCESWRDGAAGSLTGDGAFERNGARVFGEALRIEARDGGVFYVATPEGEGTTAFRLTRCASDELVFENPAHDFPTRITYRRPSADALVAIVEGTDDGGVRRVEFAMQRVTATPQENRP